MDMTPPPGVEGLAIDRDLSSGHYAVRGFGLTTRLRAWTFGERRRLLEACVGPGGFDDERFVMGLNELVYAPPPPLDLGALFAHVALCLFGISAHDRAVPQAEADVRLARGLGLLPAQTDAQPAPELDRMVRKLASPSFEATEDAGARADDGWTRIVVVDE